MAKKSHRARVALRQRRCTRIRVGRVSVYEHHGAWWLYYRDDDKVVRRRIGHDQATAERLSSDVNGQLAIEAPTPFAFNPISVKDLRDRFVDHHETVLRSSLATVSRYRSATQHLVDYVESLSGKPKAHEISAAKFMVFLRQREVSPNGHQNTARRKLKDKGLRFVLEVCRSLYAYAAKHQHLPPYAANPFADLNIDRLRVMDAKPVFVFTEETALAFLQAADAWAFSIHATLALTGMRPGELGHLLIEDLDFATCWLRVCNKTELGWQIKTRNERRIPLIPELCELLRGVVGTRRTGLVFVRREFGSLATHRPELSRRTMTALLQERVQQLGEKRQERVALQRAAQGVWRDVGLVDADKIRCSFIRIAKQVDLPEATCPKSWRHSLATLLQDANVDPLIRQITLGHQPQGSEGALGMTTVYTHTRPETQAREIERAWRTWPSVLSLIAARAKGGAAC